MVITKFNWPHLTWHDLTWVTRQWPDVPNMMLTLPSWVTWYWPDLTQPSDMKLKWHGVSKVVYTSDTIDALRKHDYNISDMSTSWLLPGYDCNVTRHDSYAFIATRTVHTIDMTTDLTTKIYIYCPYSTWHKKKATEYMTTVNTT